MFECMPLGIPSPVDNYSLQLGRQTKFYKYVQPTWYMQILTEFLYFSAERSLSCIHLVPHWVWWNQQWLFYQQDLSASRSTGLFLLSISMRYDSTCNKPCILSLPHTEIVSVFSGSAYKPTSIFDAPANSRWTWWLLLPFTENFFAWGSEEN